MENVYDTFDIWLNSFGQEIHSSFEGIEKIDLDYLGDRNNLLAHSCIGGEDPILNYEPGNKTCSSFLDRYCSSPDQYNQDLCKHRPLVQINNNQTNQTSISYFWYIVIGAFILFFGVVIIFLYRKHSIILMPNNKWPIK